jgi:dihydrodipicolinate synthase/N-acetylneuraminate lyase
VRVLLWRLCVLEQESDGCSGVFVCGTSGESMSLTLDERKAALEEWVKHKGSLDVIAQIGTTRHVSSVLCPLSHVDILSPLVC